MCRCKYRRWRKLRAADSHQLLTIASKCQDVIIKALPKMQHKCSRMFHFRKMEHLEVDFSVRQNFM